MPPPGRSQVSHNGAWVEIKNVTVEDMAVKARTPPRQPDWAVGRPLFAYLKTGGSWLRIFR